MDSSTRLYGASSGRGTGGSSAGSGTPGMPAAATCTGSGAVPASSVGLLME
jgi:hypothetical protein